LNTDQAVRLMTDLGPTILSVVGATLGVTFTGFAALARAAWRSHNGRMDSMAMALIDLAKGIAESKAHVEREHQKIRDVVQGLRAEVHLSNRGTEETKTGLLRVEGALDSHRLTLYQHIEKLGILDGKISKLFQFVDAPRRATDKY